MAGYRARAREARDRVFAPSIYQTVRETADRVQQALLPELAEIRRIIGDQGDAADEIAEITGRTLARLSAEVADLRAEVADLRAALERVGLPTDPPGQESDATEAT